MTVLLEQNQQKKRNASYFENCTYALTKTEMIALKKDGKIAKGVQHPPWVYTQDALLKMTKFIKNDASFAVFDILVKHLLTTKRIDQI